MSTSYIGFQSYISSAPGPTAPYGRFIAGMSADDLDLDDAQHLMALAMAAMDDCQWLGWRVGYLNVVEGSAGNSSLTAAINNWNQWNLKGGFAFSGTLAAFTGTTLLLNTAAYIINGKTLQAGHSTLGIGFFVADGAAAGAGSGFSAINGADVVVDGAGGRNIATGGAQIIQGSGANAIISNLPASTADPGDDNALSGANIIKCVANFVTDGAGALVPDGGYNFASVALTGTNARITFARALPNAHYCVKGSISTSSGTFKVYAVGVFGRHVAHCDIAACATLDNASGGSYVDLSNTTDIVSFMIEITCPR